MADPTDLQIHLSPRSVSALARAAGPDLLVLTHLYPELDPDLLPDLMALEGYRGRVLTGRDGLTLEVGAGEARLRSGGVPSTTEAELSGRKVLGRRRGVMPCWW